AGASTSHDVQLSEFGHNPFRIINTSRPRTTTGELQCGPEASVRGKVRIGREIWPPHAAGKNRRAFLGCAQVFAFSDEIHAAFKLSRVNPDTNAITINQFANRSTSEPFRPDVS